MKITIVGIITGVLTGLFLAVLGGAFVLAGSSATADARPFDDGIITTARVVGAVEDHALIDNIAHPTFAPVYEYEDVAGQLQRVVDHISADSRPLAVGSTVEISDLPGDPDSVRRTDVDRSWLGWFVVGGGIAAAIGAAIALGSFVVGVFAIVRISRRNRRARPHVRTPLIS